MLHGDSLTFYYKPEVQQGPRELQYGLIAEEVAAVNPDLVEHSPSGEPFTVRYQALVPMLLSELRRQDRQPGGAGSPAPSAGRAVHGARAAPLRSGRS